MYARLSTHKFFEMISIAWEFRLGRRWSRRANRPPNTSGTTVGEMVGTGDRTLATPDAIKCRLMRDAHHPECASTISPAKAIRKQYD
jgi:hypothetical protein